MKKKLPGRFFPQIFQIFYSYFSDFFRFFPQIFQKIFPPIFRRFSDFQEIFRFFPQIFRRFSDFFPRFFRFFPQIFQIFSQIIFQIFPKLFFKKSVQKIAPTKMWVLVSHGDKIIGEPAKSESAIAKRLGVFPTISQ